MSVHAGPRLLTTDGLIFYVDGRNLKSNVDNKIKDLIVGEEENSNANVIDGYYYTNYNEVEQFTDTQFSDLDAFTVNVLVSHEIGKTGYAFSILSDDIIGYETNKVSTSYSQTTNNTTATSSVSGTPSLPSASAITSSYNYVPVTVLATNSVDAGPGYSASSNTSYTQAVSNTIATSVVNDPEVLPSVTAITSSYNYVPVTVIATTIKRSNINTLFEISLYADSNQAIVTNRSNDNVSTLAYSTDTQKTQYSIIYRKYLENSVPISMYINGKFVADTGIVSGLSQFENYGIRMFNKFGSSFAEYGVRSLSIYNRALTPLEITLINRIEPIK
jgi:hypothetical protein